MTSALRAGISTRCPRCYRLVHVSVERHVDEDGDVYVDAVPVWNALSIHMRSRLGCTVGGRST